jgi:hypothetical protein
MPPIATVAPEDQDDIGGEGDPCEKGRLSSPGSPADRPHTFGLKAAPIYPRRQSMGSFPTSFPAIYRIFHNISVDIRHNHS